MPITAGRWMCGGSADVVTVRFIEEGLGVMDDVVLVTVKEYAGLLGVHPQTVYTAIRQGRLRHPVVRPFGTSAVRIEVPSTLVRKAIAA